MTNEQILSSLEKDEDYNFEPIRDEKYGKLVESITHEKKLELISHPTIEKMREVLSSGHRSLDLLQQYYLLPFLLTDFHRRNPKYLYDKNRLNNYLNAFWTVLDEMGVQRTFKVYMIEKCERLLSKSEGLKNQVLSKIVRSIEKLNKEYDTVQIAYSAMIVEKLIRIQTLEVFHSMDRKGLIKDFDFDEINSYPLSKLLDSGFELTEKGSNVYRCLRKENKVFAFNAEFRKMSKDILVDRTKWSIRNKHIHSAIEVSNTDTKGENDLIRVYLVYFIFKHNTSLVEWNWEYIEDHWNEIYPDLK